jgi:hypothetical protein
MLVKKLIYLGACLLKSIYNLIQGGGLPCFRVQEGNQTFVKVKGDNVDLLLVGLDMWTRRVLDDQPHVKPKHIKSACPM